MKENEILILQRDIKKSKLFKKTKKYYNDIWEIKRKHKNKEALEYKYKDEFKYHFGLRLYQYAYGKHYDFTTTILPKNSELRTIIINSYRKTNNSSSFAKQFQRLSLGYNSIPYNFTAKRCNLSSKAVECLPLM